MVIELDQDNYKKLITQAARFERNRTRNKELYQKNKLAECKTVATRPSHPPFSWKVISEDKDKVIIELTAYDYRRLETMVQHVENHSQILRLVYQDAKKASGKPVKPPRPRASPLVWKVVEIK